MRGKFCEFHTVLKKLTCTNLHSQATNFSHFSYNGFSLRRELFWKHPFLVLSQMSEAEKISTKTHTKMELVLKCMINEKSTIFVQIQWNFGNLNHEWDGQIGKVSSKLDKNCRFFINRQFLGHFPFLLISLYLVHFFFTFWYVDINNYVSNPTNFYSTWHKKIGRYLK